MPIRAFLVLTWETRVAMRPHTRVIAGRYREGRTRAGWGEFLVHSKPEQRSPLTKDKIRRDLTEEVRGEEYET